MLNFRFFDFSRNLKDFPIFRYLPIPLAPWSLLELSSFSRWFPRSLLLLPLPPLQLLLLLLLLLLPSYLPSSFS